MNVWVGALLALGSLCAGGCDASGGSRAMAETTAGPKPVSSPIRRCMNLSNALEAPREGEWGYVIQRAHIAKIAEAGFDTVRLPVDFDDHAADEPPYTIDPALLRRVDEVVGWALAEGLQVIIDLHHYGALNGDPDAHIPRLQAMWDQLARHYAEAPETVMFEFLNEPYRQMGPKRVDRVNRLLLERVRQDNPDRWVIMPGAGWGTLEGWLETDPPFDPRAMTTFHYYAPFEFTFQGAAFGRNPPPPGQQWGSPEDYAEVARDFDRAEAKRDRTGMPVLNGEFGVYKDVPLEMRVAWTEHVRRESEQAGFGWCYWGFGTYFRAYDLEADAWIEPLLDALMSE